METDGHLFVRRCLIGGRERVGWVLLFQNPVVETARMKQFYPLRQDQTLGGNRSELGKRDTRQVVDGLYTQVGANNAPRIKVRKFASRRSCSFKTFL